MKTEDIMLRWGTHYAAIKRIGGKPIYKTLQLSDLGENPDDTKTMKSETQRCYIDMKKDKLEISVIDYLCWISSQYILDMAVKNASDKKYIEYIKKNNGSFKEEFNNLLRLASKKPELLKEFGDTRELVVMWHDNYMNSIKSKS